MSDRPLEGDLNGVFHRAQGESVRNSDTHDAASGRRDSVDAEDKMNQHGKEHVAGLTTIGSAQNSEDHRVLLSPTDAVQADVHELNGAALLKFDVRCVFTCTLDTKLQDYPHVVREGVDDRGDRVEDKVVIGKEFVEANQWGSYEVLLHLVWGEVVVICGAFCIGSHILLFPLEGWEDNVLTVGSKDSDGGQWRLMRGSRQHLWFVVQRSR